ncbi:MAG: hypothetical protein ABIQ31_25765 [Ferruginibacter sp.]
MHRIHSGFTVAVAIKNGESGRLKALLKQLNKDESKSLVDFAGSETALFVSGVILPAQNYHGEMLPETFVLATTFCGPFSRHLDDLLRTSKRGLCEIFRHCEGFPENGLARDIDLAGYLRSHKYRSAFKSRYSGITKKDVQEEKVLRRQIETYLDKLRGLNVLDGLSPKSIKALIQRHIKTHATKFNCADRPARSANFQEILSTWRVAVFLMVFEFFLFLVIALLVTYYICFCTLFFIGFLLITMAVGFGFYIASKKSVTASRPPDSHVRRITATQLHPVINEMTAAAPLKKGQLRKYFYAFALRVISIAGLIMDIPTVSSIRWLVVDKRRRLVFLSNYANTTDFYVRDFLNGTTPKGINFMFSNGMGFPDAVFFYSGGVMTDPEGYMNVIHTHQHVTDLWYAHEQSLTVDNINKNRKIRDGLFKRMSDKEAKEWLRLF